MLKDKLKTHHSLVVEVNLTSPLASAEIISHQHDFLKLLKTTKNWVVSEKIIRIIPISWAFEWLETCNHLCFQCHSVPEQRLQ